MTGKLPADLKMDPSSGKNQRFLPPISSGAIATGNRFILIRCAEHHPQGEGLGERTEGKRSLRRGPGVIRGQAGICDDGDCHKGEGVLRTSNAHPYKGERGVVGAAPYKGVTPFRQPSRAATYPAGEL